MAGEAEAAVAAYQRAILGGDQRRKDMHSAGLYRKIVIPAAVRLAPILGNTQSSAFRPVVGCELLHPHHAVSDAMNGLVVRFRSHVVEQEYGYVAPAERVLQGQNLTAISSPVLISVQQKFVSLLVDQKIQLQQKLLA